MLVRNKYYSRWSTQKRKRKSRISRMKVACFVRRRRNDGLPQWQSRRPRLWLWSNNNNKFVSARVWAWKFYFSCVFPFWNSNSNKTERKRRPAKILCSFLADETKIQSCHVRGISSTGACSMGCCVCCFHCFSYSFSFIPRELKKKERKKPFFSSTAQLVMIFANNLFIY